MNQHEQSSKSPRPTFNSIAAHAYVSDVAAALAFYTGKLGFALDFAYGEPPFYAQVSRDCARIALRLVPAPVFADGIREREQLLCASITVESADEIEQLFLAFQATGVDFHQMLRKQPWGARDFVISDPDSNLILFAGPAG
ncbi:MAG TPA: VOC family protein [Rhodanobacter sp.]